MKPQISNSNSRPLISNAGFTLTEILVVALIFSLIVVIFSSTFISSSGLQKRAFNIQQVEENASYVLESMTKEIRVSRVSGPDTSCPSSPASSLTIDHPVNGNITYSLSGGDIHRNVNVNGQYTDTIVSSNTVEFTRLQFCILGTAVQDGKQPRVIILASVRSKNVLQRASMDIQTAVSQRFLAD
jgi:prepilin-type N-terminal cleavage/methylation domain-containing protein